MPKPKTVKTLVESSFVKEHTSHFWQPSTSKIPQHLASHRNTRSHNARVANGGIEAIGLALRGARAYTSSGYLYLAHNGTTFGLLPGAGFFNVPEWYGIHLVALAAAAAKKYPDALEQEVNERWRDLLKTLHEQSHVVPFHHDDHLQFAFNETVVQERVLALADSLYFYVKENFDPNSEIETHTFTLPTDNELDLFGNGSIRSVRIKPLPVLQTVKNALLWNMNTLLLGPTSTFKTTTAKRAATELGIRFVDVKGMPSSDEAVLYGADKTSSTSATGFAFVDGPVTTAFRLARQEKVMLLIDELLRFDAPYRDTLIGVMDSYTPDEVKGLGCEPLGDSLHYQLALPNGERLFCPKENLVFIATSNIENGFDSSLFSDALRRRFNWLQVVDYPDETILRPMYLSVFDNAKAVDFALGLELFTRDNTTTGVNAGLLERCANPAVMMTLLETAKRLVEGGMSLAEALLQGSELTVIPYCIPFDSVGNPDSSAADLIRMEVRNLV
jgi:hypothetical protein